MTTDQLRERIAIAKAATPGPWIADVLEPNEGSGTFYEGECSVSDQHGLFICRRMNKFRGVDGDTMNRDAIHIAANRPEDVVELCEELIAARAEIERLRSCPGCREVCDCGLVRK